MSVHNYTTLREHLGHHVVVVEYGDGINVAIECEDCNEVLLDYDYDGEYVEDLDETTGSGDLKEFNLYATWTSGKALPPILAASYEEACAVALGSSYPLPQDPDYLEDSFDVSPAEE